MARSDIFLIRLQAADLTHEQCCSVFPKVGENNFFSCSHNALSKEFISISFKLRKRDALHNFFCVLMLLKNSIILKASVFSSASFTGI